MVLRPWVSGAGRSGLQRGPGSVGIDPHLREAGQPGRWALTPNLPRESAGGFGVVSVARPGARTVLWPHPGQQSGGGGRGASSSRRGMRPARWQGPGRHVLLPAHPRDGRLWLFRTTPFPLAVSCRALQVRAPGADGARGAGLCRPAAPSLQGLRPT